MTRDRRCRHPQRRSCRGGARRASAASHGDRVVPDNPSRLSTAARLVAVPRRARRRSESKGAARGARVWLAISPLEACAWWRCNRPNRQKRRRRGKSDTVDAEAAARAVLSGEATVTPKAANGPVEALRQLRVARCGAMKARTAAANQIHSLCDTAPDAMRAQLTGLTMRKKIAVVERWRPGIDSRPPTARPNASLVSVARRWRALDDEVAELDASPQGDPRRRSPRRCLASHGVGYETAGQLLVTAGDNPTASHTRAATPRSAAASPVQRLIRQAPTTTPPQPRRRPPRQLRALDASSSPACRNHHPHAHYVERRTKEGLSKPEIIRCLKRYVARELFPHIRAITDTNTHAATPLDTQRRPHSRAGSGRHGGDDASKPTRVYDSPIFDHEINTAAIEILDDRQRYTVSPNHTARHRARPWRWRQTGSTLRSRGGRICIANGRHRERRRLDR